MANKLSVTRHKTNPFVEGMVIETRRQQVRLSAIGKDKNILINEATGESHGTHVVTYKKVDSEEFVKIFSRNIAMIFDLTAAGLKAFNILIFTLQNQQDNDLVTLDKYTLADFLEAHGKSISEPTFRRGLAELEASKIIAKALRAGDYFINPNFVFNGNRIAFSTIIERSEGDEHQQQSLPI